MKDRNIFVLRRIVQYSNEIIETISRFDLDFNKFQNDNVMKNAIAMCVLQIGELSNNLTDEFKIKHDKILWKEFVLIRNKAAHNYWNFHAKILWDISTDRVPELKQYCESIIEEMEL